jgi:hypothetical protein
MTEDQKKKAKKWLIAKVEAVTAPHRQEKKTEPTTRGEKIAKAIADEAEFSGRMKTQVAKLLSVALDIKDINPMAWTKGAMIVGEKFLMVVPMTAYGCHEYDVDEPVLQWENESDIMLRMSGTTGNHLPLVGEYIGKSRAATKEEVKRFFDTCDIEKIVDILKLAFV